MINLMSKPCSSLAYCAAESTSEPLTRFSTKISIEALRFTLIDQFSELSCMSSSAAISILLLFPEYRYAKESLGHSFWESEAHLMLDGVASAMSRLEGGADFEHTHIGQIVH